MIATTPMVINLLSGLSYLIFLLVFLVIIAYFGEKIWRWWK